METEINLPLITDDATGPKAFIMKLTRAKLEQLTGDLVKDYRPVHQGAFRRRLKLRI